MKSKNSLLKVYKKKIKEIKKHNNLYFNYDRPEISDEEYDYLKKDIITLEKKKFIFKKTRFT